MLGETDGRLLATGLVLFHLLLLMARVGGANGSRQQLLGATTRLGDHAADSNCPQSPRAGDYLQIDGVTYYLDVASQVNYFSATAACEEQGKILLRFETLAKSDRIIAALNANPNFRDNYIWTSGRHGEGAYRGQWYWGYNSTFGPRITEFDWAPEQPFWPEANENYISCICFLPSKEGWEDHLCDAVYMGFICQPALK